MRTARTIFIFELKLDKGPDEALSHIIDRRYYDNAAVCLFVMVGVYLDSAKGRDWDEISSCP